MNEIANVLLVVTNVIPKQKLINNFLGEHGKKGCGSLVHETLKFAIS